MVRLEKHGYELWKDMMTKEDYELLTKNLTPYQKEKFDLWYEDTNSLMGLGGHGLITNEKYLSTLPPDKANEMRVKQQERRKNIPKMLRLIEEWAAQYKDEQP